MRTMINTLFAALFVLFAANANATAPVVYDLDTVYVGGGEVTATGDKTSTWTSKIGHASADGKFVSTGDGCATGGCEDSRFEWAVHADEKVVGGADALTDTGKSGSSEVIGDFGAAAGAWLSNGNSEIGSDTTVEGAFEANAAYSGDSGFSHTWGNADLSSVVDGSGTANGCPNNLCGTGLFTATSTGHVESGAEAYASGTNAAAVSNSGGANLGFTNAFPDP